MNHLLVPNNQIRPSSEDDTFEIELHRVPIVWNLKNGNFTFFGLDSALFWTNPSLMHIFLPLVEEIGADLFRLLVAYSSSLGTKEDYQNMVSVLADNFPDGFMAWGQAVSSAGWGAFELSEFSPDTYTATVIVRNPWEMNMQRELSVEQRWGCPFLQGKIIGIFNYAFGRSCWADDICRYDEENSYSEFKIYASYKTVEKEIEKLQKDRMEAREKALENEVQQKTSQLIQAKLELEEHSKTLEKKVAERTEELLLTNDQLRAEILVRKQAEEEKEKLINELREALREVKTLSGLLPICSSCKKIRDDKGYWYKLEAYIQEHSEAKFSHSICDECSDKLYSNEEWYKKIKSKQSDNSGTGNE